MTLCQFQVDLLTKEVDFAHFTTVRSDNSLRCIREGCQREQLQKGVTKTLIQLPA